MLCNEIGPFAAEWTRALIRERALPDGHVDERSIEDVFPADLAGLRECHFFAGIGVWPKALRLAGWPRDLVTWTGSCPCQPFSPAGKGGGFDDERHLWPAWFHLIEHCRPDVIFGEQVADRGGAAWLDLVCDDLEAVGYTVWADVSPAAGYGAPHPRHRLYWMAHSDDARLQGRGIGGHSAGEQTAWSGGLAGGLAEPHGERRERRRSGEKGDRAQAFEPVAGFRDAGHRPRPTDGFWRDADWLGCRDGKFRPVEPGTQPLAHGAANRVGRLRGYGNAIVLPQAAQFVSDVMRHLGLEAAA